MRTVINRRPVRGGLLATAVAGLLCLGASGCGGGGDEETAGKDVAGTQLCGGDAVSAQASEALKVITGSSRFGTTAEKSTVARAAMDLVEVFPALTGGRDDVCRIYTADGTPDFAIRVTWGLDDGNTTGAPASDFTVLPMGERTLAAANRASVLFACRSDRFPNSTNAAHVAIGAERWGMPTEPEGNVEALKDAYATVAHSFSLAMAKELRCEKNGGLPARPVLDPA
ncbi:hypothetical protein ACH4MG_25690 [Streptomyces sp. NPDC017454]|uniref:hypothetical protein n=1 Tax=Streptomyces sp. NPDC017454 TaxID=3364997 RepID=UPI003797D5B1